MRIAAIKLELIVARELASSDVDADLFGVYDDEEYLVADFYERVDAEEYVSMKREKKVTA